MDTIKYRVGPNDTILTIARRFRVKPAVIAQLNQHKGIVRSSITEWDFRPGSLRVGDLLNVPNTLPRPPRQHVRTGRRAGVSDEACGDGQHLVDFGDYVGCVSDLTGQPCANGGTYNDYGECVGGNDGGMSIQEALDKILNIAGGGAAYNAYQAGQDGATYASNLGPEGRETFRNVCKVVIGSMAYSVIGWPFIPFIVAGCNWITENDQKKDPTEGSPCQLPGGGNGKIVNGSCVNPCSENEFYDPADDSCGCERAGFRRQDPNDYNSPCIDLNKFPQPCGAKAGDGFYIMEPGGECIFSGAGDTCQQVEPAGGFVYGTYAKNGACIPDAAKTKANKPEWLCEQYGGPPGSIVWLSPLDNAWYCLQPCGPNETLDKSDGMCACNSGYKRDKAGTCVKSSTTPPGGGEQPPKTPPGKVPPKGGDKPPIKPTTTKKEEGNGLLYAGAGALALLALWLGTRKKKAGS